MPQKTTNADVNLEKVVNHFKDLKDESYQSRTNNDAVPWVRPPTGEWDGDLQSRESLIALHKAFNTNEAEEILKQTFSVGKAGNSSDVIVNTLQIEYAAQMERAYRARHQTLPRALAHFSTRERGHGTESGALRGASLEYFMTLIKQGVEDPASPTDEAPDVLGDIDPSIGGIA